MVQDFEEDRIYRILTKLIFQYIFLLGKCRIIIFFVIYLLSIGLYIAIDVWTGIWSTNSFEFDLRDYMLVYLGISFVASFFAVFRDTAFIRSALQNSKKVHNMACEVFLNMSLSWFNEHPTCEIDYKLSYDMRIVDNNINDQL